MKKTLDDMVLEFLTGEDSPMYSSDDYSIKFDNPNDPIYRPGTGRASHDFVCKVSYTPPESTEFPITIWINNKLGDLTSRRRNDVTTYNNLLRLYLDINQPRLRDASLSESTLATISRRLENREIVAYGVLAIDKKLTDYNFFLLEQLSGELYINPRNTMLQVPYKPETKEEITPYIDFLRSLLGAIKKVLSSSKTSIDKELSAIQAIEKSLGISCEEIER